MDGFIASLAFNIFAIAIIAVMALKLTDARLDTEEARRIAEAQRDDIKTLRQSKDAALQRISELWEDAQVGRQAREQREAALAAAQASNALRKAMKSNGIHA